MLPMHISTSLPHSIYRAELVREHEKAIAQQLNIDMFSLMKDAGLSSFELLIDLWPNTKTLLVVCGSGNNAGDGFVVARLALLKGINVYVHSLTALSNYNGDAQTAVQQYIEAGGEVHAFNDVDFKRVDVIVDALIGTGLAGEVKENYRYVIDFVNKLNTPVLSIDIPSGLNGNTGSVNGCAIKADTTVTFIAYKAGLFTGRAADYCGQIYLADLGIGKTFVENINSNLRLNYGASIPAILPRLNCAHKGNSGFVLACGGNAQMPGAIRLAAEATMRAGAGLVAVSCHQKSQLLVAATRPELMLLDLTNPNIDEQQKLQRINAVVVGPGLGTDEWAKLQLEKALSLSLPTVVDADALNLIAQQEISNGNWILTPHPGEAARLLGCSIKEVEQDRYRAVKLIAKRYGGVCVLKGAGTLISDGDTVAINYNGNSGMAVAGMGDVLAGIMSALILQSDCLFSAAKIAVYIHGKAADLASLDGKKGMLASDLFPIIRQLVNQ